GAARADGQERPARDRPHQRLRALRRPGALCRQRDQRRAGRPGGAPAGGPPNGGGAGLGAPLPSLASFDYGTPFYDIFKRYNHDFYKIDPLLFSPAEVWLTSATSGETFHSGRLNPNVLRESLFD